MAGMKTLTIASIATTRWLFSTPAWGEGCARRAESSLPVMPSVP